MREGSAATGRRVFSSRVAMADLFVFVVVSFIVYGLDFRVLESLGGGPQSVIVGARCRKEEVGVAPLLP